jgi:hypothetical protein
MDTIKINTQTKYQTNTTTNVIAPVDHLVPTLGLKLRSGLEADYVLAHSITNIEKILFLLTNAPFWFVFFSSFMYLVQHNDELATVSICEHPLSYCIVSFFVAFSSSLMHSAQVQIGSFICCCGDSSRIEQFHHPQNQVLFKKFDITCALFGGLAAISCHHDIFELVYAATIAIPLFIMGLYFKRIDWHRAYLISHGLWHIMMVLPMLFKFV